jgi:hypothetical protein
MDGPTLMEGIESAIRGAAEGQKVTLVVLSVGKGVSVSKEEIVQRLSQEFPSASIELLDGGAVGSVTVKEIEVE